MYPLSAKFISFETIVFAGKKNEARQLYNLQTIKNPIYDRFTRMLCVNPHPKL